MYIKTRLLCYVYVFMKYVGHEFTNGGPFFHICKFVLYDRKTSLFSRVIKRKQ